MNGCLYEEVKSWPLDCNAKHTNTLAEKRQLDLAGRLDLRDKPRAILLSCAKHLTLHADMGGMQGTDRNKQTQDRIVRASRPMRFYSMPSATGGIARLVAARLRAAGIQLAPLLSRAGLTVEQIDDASVRLPVQSQIRLLELASEALHDDFLGFHLAQDYDLREIGLFYYVLASSDILADALHRAERYSGITNEGISLQARIGKETVIALSYIDIDRRSDRHQIEFWLISLVRLCRQLTNRRLVPSRVRVAHRRNKTPPDFRSYLGCDIEFGSNVDEVVFPAAVKLMPIVSADPYLNQLLLKYCEEALAHRPAKGATLRSSVENAITPLLPHGKANAGEVARQLGMSHRTLARRLAAEKLTFSEIQTELKTDLARRYLRDGDLPISQIAWLLGYREVSAFTHAFKRWTGTAPRQSRAQGKFVSAGKRARTAGPGAQARPRR
jgi:AraC-like DNA-binding protein